MLSNTLGEIRLFAGNFEPEAWRFCQGQIIEIKGNEALYSLLGTNYGGDGKVTFGLPDLRGRAPISGGQGKDLPSYKLAEKGGVEKAAMTVDNMPRHSHSGKATFEGKASLDASNSVYSNSGNPQNQVPANYKFEHLYAKTTDGTMGGGIDVSVDQYSDVKVSETGGGLPFDIMSPFVAINYIICVSGVYPQHHMHG